MSDLEEPPAKVLKIDNIDGVTHVTELSHYPETFDGVVEEEIMGVESGVIEGGAEPENEEWLSEGILTDDDYNPASQETVGDQTDSQLGTGDEEHLDSTLDSEANLVETEENLADSEANISDNGANIFDNGANISDNGANISDNGANTSDNGANISDNGANFADNGALLVDSVANTADSEPVLAEAEANMNETEANLSDTDASGADIEANVTENGEHPAENLMEVEANDSIENGINTEDSEADLTTSDANVTQSETQVTVMETSNIHSDIMESQTYTQEEEKCPLKIAKLKSNVVNSGNASDIIIQRVLTLNKNTKGEVIKSKSAELNIEETMKHLDGKEDVKSDDFEKFLNKSTVVKTEVRVKQVVKQEPDGNDTDDLLRMLGEGDSKNKRLTKTVKDIREKDEGSSDDDDFVYEGTSASMKNLKAAKSALAKKQPVKAEQEDMGDGDDETEMSADEAKTMQRMFNSNAKPTMTRRVPKASPAVVKRLPSILNVIERPLNTKPPVKPPAKQYQNKRLQSNGQSILKPTTPATRSAAAAAAAAAKPPTPKYTEVKVPYKPTTIKTPAPFISAVSLQTIDKKTEKKILPGKTKIEPGKTSVEPAKMFRPGNVQLEQVKAKFEPRNIHPRQVKVDPGKVNVEPGKDKFEPARSTVAPRKVTTELRKPKVEPEEMIAEEFLDDEEYGMDEDEFVESDTGTSHHRQRIMRPEMMDEEVPSDGESASEDGSLYDELPSSDSDDMDDWFTLDIRSEKAGDYIPLLGPKAQELLLEEKRRVSARLSTLKQSHTALIASGKQQAATLRRATATLAELDDMLRAA